MSTSGLSGSSKELVRVQTASFDSDQLWGLITVLENAAQTAGHAIEVIIDLTPSATDVVLSARTPAGAVWLSEYASNGFDASIADVSRRLRIVVGPIESKDEADSGERSLVPGWAHHDGPFVDFGEARASAPTSQTMTAQAFLTIFDDGSLAEELGVLAPDELTLQPN